MSVITDQFIARQERAFGADLSYLRSLADTSTAAFAKFVAAMPAAGHRRVVPAAPWHLARLAATRVQDCGTCVQIVVNAALADGVTPDALRSALGEGAALTDDERLALRYGAAIASQDEARAEAIEAVRARWGEAGLVEMALSVAMVQTFPILKRGLSQDVACARVEVRL